METVLQIVGGLVLLGLGGEGIVRGAVGVARRLGLSELVIGITLVAFGGAMPELITSLNAAMHNATSLAVGNVVGSNISNVLLILGLSAVVRPLPSDAKALERLDAAQPRDRGLVAVCAGDQLDGRPGDAGPARLLHLHHLSQ